MGHLDRDFEEKTILDGLRKKARYGVLIAVFMVISLWNVKNPRKIRK